MKFTEFSRNLIQCSNFFSVIYDFMCSFGLYKKFVQNKINKRTAYLKTHKEIKFMIELSSICNAECFFCPYINMNREKKTMSDEIFFKITDRIKEEKIFPVSFELWNIGEPFLDKKIFERIKFLKKNFPGVPVKISSNFEILNVNMIEKLLDSDIDFINISLNAVDKKTYHDIMGLDYDKVIKNMETLIRLKKEKKKKTRICLSMILYNTRFFDVIKILLKYSFKVDAIRLQKAANWMTKVNNENKIYKSTRKLYPCNEIWEKTVILSNGEYALCCQDSEGIFKKNILEASIGDIFYSEHYENIRKIHSGENLRNFEMCKNCFGINSNGANWLFKERY
ncbi:MAG: radical SAM protein [Endomicrobiaceae bacterium]|nr:radical SAM protein [Endomicrobiaceae bacterium]